MHWTVWNALINSTEVRYWVVRPCSELPWGVVCDAHWHAHVYCTVLICTGLPWQEGNSISLQWSVTKRGEMLGCITEPRGAKLFCCYIVRPAMYRNLKLPLMKPWRAMKLFEHVCAIDRNWQLWDAHHVVSFDTHACNLTCCDSWQYDAWWHGNH